jgi:phage virion morphogenesis protein
MSTALVQVDDSSVKVALGKFHLSLAQNAELLREIGASQLLSVRRTFRDQGSPANSWVPLAPSTIAKNPSKYGSGHKLLIDKGDLLNSIGFHTEPGLVIIGTNLKYAPIHQFGSRDHGGISSRPLTLERAESTVKVKEHSYDRLSKQRVGKMRIVNAAGRNQTVRRMILGPRNQFNVNVRSFSRHQNIPARPYLVFRPEDPRRIQSLVNSYCRRASIAAGLGGAQ